MRLRIPPLGLFLVSTTASALAEAVTAVALPWLVLERTGSAAQAGLVGTVGGLAMVLAGAVGGTIVDRFGRRRASVLADLLSALGVAGLPIVDGLFGLTLPAFVLLAVLGAMFDAPGMAAREALLFEVATASGQPVERITSLREAFAQVSWLAGPALAAAGIALAGAANTLLVTAGAFVLAALATALLRLPAAASAGPAESRGSLVAETLAGWRFVLGDPVLRALGLFTVAEYLILAPFTTLLLPAHLRLVGDSAQFGAIVAGFAIGTAAGSLVFGLLARPHHRHAWFTTSVVASLGLLWLAALLPPFAVLLPTLVLTGLAGAPIGALLYTLVQERAAEALRARVFAIMAMLSAAASAAGLGVTGLAVEHLGTRTSALLAACGFGAIALGWLFSPIPRALRPRPGGAS